MLRVKRRRHPITKPAMNEGPPSLERPNYFPVPRGATNSRSPALEFRFPLPVH